MEMTTTPAGDAGAVGQPPSVDPALVIARGKRVYLRVLTPGDFDYVVRLAKDPFIEKMVGSELLQALRDAEGKAAAVFESCLRDPTQVAMVVMAARGGAEPIGFTRLFNIHVDEGYAFLETVITDPRALRKGFGVEAGKLISYYGVDALGLRRIEAKVYEYNRLSINCLRRNGFHQEGVLRKAGFRDGRYWDLLVFGILKEEIEDQRRKDQGPPPRRVAPKGRV